MNKKIIIEKLKTLGIRLFIFSVFCIAVPFLLIWCTLVIKFTFPTVLSNTLSILFPCISVFLLLIVRDISKSLQIFGLASAAVFLWYFSISPSNNRNWVEGAQSTPKITISNQLIKIENFRHFKYKSLQNVEADYETRTYDLNDLEGCDFIISYWDGYRSIGHTFVSFRFKNQAPISISVEVRKEKGEDYTPVKGLFKQYELIYIIGDERDLISLRTNHRAEETFLYPLELNKEDSKKFLLSLLRGAQETAEEPKFYNSLSQNCTTTLIDHANDMQKFKIKVNMDLLLNGLSDYAVYKLEGLTNELEFSVLKRCCYISKLSKMLALDKNYSKNLRKSVHQKIQSELKESQ